MEKLIAFVGIFVMLGMGYALCPKDKRSSISWRLVFTGILLQFVFAILILKTAPGKMAFSYANDLIGQLLDYTKEGSKFIFGDLASADKPSGFIFAFQVLPTIIFFSSLMSVLYHIGIMQRVVNVVAVIMYKVMGTSGAESLSNAANVFVGQTEAPLVIKPFLAKLTKSELLAIMAGGMANTAGGILAAYVGMFQNSFPEIAGHLIAASLMSAPASFVFAKIILPETEEPETKGSVTMTDEKVAANVIDAIAVGASEGLSLAINVAAMLIAFIAIIAMFNGIIGGIGNLLGFPGVSLQFFMGYLFAPLAYLMGVPASETLLVGQFLGEKIVLNEFVAYIDMSKNMDNLSATSKIVCAYALSGFANLSSIAIQIGGIGALAPERRGDLSRLGLKAMIAGNFASFQTATIAALLLSI
ncbi:NupC/NupG family nucleoside CNT transporter [bacterium]|nr:MAG: NupC/NupG family nucleoside CNT transporter [bacterium]